MRYDFRNVNVTEEPKCVGFLLRERERERVRILLLRREVGMYQKTYMNDTIYKYDGHGCVHRFIHVFL